MSVHFDFANGKFVYTWQVISDDGSKYITSNGQLITKNNLVPPAGTPLAFIEYTTKSVSSFLIRQSFFTGTNPNYDVDWGDGTTETAVTSTNKAHTYSTAGVYTIKITPASGSVLAPLFWMDQDLEKVDGTGGSELFDVFAYAFNSSSLTSFGAIDISHVSDFFGTWGNCTGLTSFPLLDFSSASTISSAWDGCTSLTTFPANAFDNLPSGNFTANNAFRNCALTAQSIENILTSLDTSGKSNIYTSFSGGTNAAKTTWSTAANTAYTNLINKGWTIAHNP